MFSLLGKKALVTGASGGIGSKIVEHFLEAGASVCIVGSNEEKLIIFKKLLQEKSYQGNIEHMICDLKDILSVEKLCTEAHKTLNGLDILVCNAGITKDALSIRMKNEDWQEVINVNLTANFILNREACKLMVKQKYGRIVNIASVVGITGNAGQANYSASKGGLISMSKSIAQEFAPRGITVNVVAPGFIETAMTEILPDSIKEQIKTRIPMGKQGESEDIASAVLFLASEEAKYITGCVLNVNGGMC